MTLGLTTDNKLRFQPNLMPTCPVFEGDEVPGINLEQRQSLGRPRSSSRTNRISASSINKLVNKLPDLKAIFTGAAVFDTDAIEQSLLKAGQTLMNQVNDAKSESDLHKASGYGTDFGIMKNPSTKEKLFWTTGDEEKRFEAISSANGELSKLTLIQGNDLVLSLDLESSELSFETPNTISDRDFAQLNSLGRLIEDFSFKIIESQNPQLTTEMQEIAIADISLVAEDITNLIKDLRAQGETFNLAGLEYNFYQDRNPNTDSYSFGISSHDSPDLDCSFSMEFNTNGDLSRLDFDRASVSASLDLNNRQKPLIVITNPELKDEEMPQSMIDDLASTDYEYAA